MWQQCGVLVYGTLIASVPPNLNSLCAIPSEHQLQCCMQRACQDEDSIQVPWDRVRAWRQPLDGCAFIDRRFAAHGLPAVPQLEPAHSMTTAPRQRHVHGHKRAQRHLASLHLWTIWLAHVCSII